MAKLGVDMEELILLRLNVKEVTKYKTVCKSWESLISSPSFIKSHLNRWIEYDRNLEGFGHRRIIMSRSRHDPRATIDPPQCDTGHICRIIGGSNGLVCCFSLNSQLVVMNPIIREVRVIPNPDNIPDFQKVSLCWGFGYDSVTDDYKVVLGVVNESDNATTISFQVLSLKSNVWKMIGDVNCTLINSRYGVLCSGALHWFMNDQNKKKKVIFSFELSSEKWKEIPQPDDTSEYREHACYLGIMKECLCIYSSEPGFPYHLWVMNNYNVQQSWVSVKTTWDMDVEAAIFLKELKTYIPHQRKLVHCMGHYKTYEFLSAPVFVFSLVSPHVNGRPKRKRQQAKNGIKKSRKQSMGDPSVPGLSA